MAKKASAFVLINVELDSEIGIQKKLVTLEGVTEVYQVYGVYDLIVKVTADSMDKLKEIITYHIRKVDNVKSTLTMIIMEEENPGKKKKIEEDMNKVLPDDKLKELVWWVKR